MDGLWKLFNPLLKQFEGRCKIFFPLKFSSKKKMIFIDKVILLNNKLDLFSVQYLNKYLKNKQVVVGVVILFFICATISKSVSSSFVTVSSTSQQMPITINPQGPISSSLIVNVKGPTRDTASQVKSRELSDASMGKITEATLWKAYFGGDSYGINYPYYHYKKLPYSYYWKNRKPHPPAAPTPVSTSLEDDPQMWLWYS